jgi:hypothetical protein
MRFLVKIDTFRNGSNLGAFNGFVDIRVMGTNVFKDFALCFVWILLFQCHSNVCSSSEFDSKVVGFSLRERGA